MSREALVQIQGLNANMQRLTQAWAGPDIAEALELLDREQGYASAALLLLLAPVFQEWGQVLSELAFQFYDLAGTCREEAA